MENNLKKKKGKTNNLHILKLFFLKENYKLHTKTHNINI